MGRRKRQRLRGFTISKRPQYENYQVLHPNGKLMFRTTRSRANWYLIRDLATLVDNNPQILRLRFEPRGPGNIDDDFFQQIRENLCVVCGQTELLTRHHIVPSCYKRFFPKLYKVNTSYDVLPLCIHCHRKAEIHCQKFRNQLADEYDVPINSGIIYNRELDRARGAASTLLTYGNIIPPDRLEELYNRAADYLGREPRRDDLIELLKLSPYNYDNYLDHCHEVVKKITDFTQFAQRWRQLFLDTMQPKFMPNGWDIDRPLNKNTSVR